MDAHKNFAVTDVSVAPSPATSGTSLTVTDASVFPATPFNATICPTGTIPTPANAEIVRVTNIAGNVLTITRTQEGTSARTVIVGDLIACTATAKVFTDIEAAIPSTVDLYAASNTTQSSSGTASISALTFAGAGYASVGVTNGSVLVSADGHTHGVQSWWANAVGDAAALIGTLVGNSLVSIRKVQIAEPVACSDMRVAASASLATAANASSAFYDYSLSAVVYSRTGSSLSSMLSGSLASWASWSSNATASLGGMNAYVVPWNTSTVLAPGEYWIALHLSTTNTATGGAATTALGNSQSMLGVNPLNTAVAGMKPVGVGVNASYGMVSGQGLVSTGATLASLAISNVTVTGSRGAAAALWVELRNYSL